MASRISPETRAYIKKTEAFVGGRKPMTLLAAAPGHLEKAVAGLSDEQLNRRPAPRKWSIKEIVGHLADMEIVYGYRYRKSMAEPGSPIPGYDQDLWTDALRYRRLPIIPMLLKYRVLRQDHMAMLRNATPAQRKHYGVHSERGRESVERIAFLLAGHDLNHLHQIQAIKKNFGWAAGKKGQSRRGARGRSAR